MPLSSQDLIAIADIVETRYAVRRADGSLVNRDVALGDDLAADQQALALLNGISAKLDALLALVTPKAA